MDNNEEVDMGNSNERNIDVAAAAGLTDNVPSLLVRVYLF